jgi:Na+-transporting NADH:ubiquinone oxidoreductase subunit NqrB
MRPGPITRFSRDPRHAQILAVGTLVLAGVIWFGVEMPWWRPVAALAAANLAQWTGARLAGTRYDWRSPTITALSLTLLLRTTGWELAALAAALAIGSKFVLRIGGRHFWNPATLAIAVVTAAFPSAWVSTGQWGVSAWIAVFAAGAGLAITRRAGRAGVPFLFLAAWGALAFGRAFWLGDPVAVPLHQMGSGALLVFAFFMISDPMTQPWHRGARAAWVVATACLGFALQSAWIVTAGPIWGLALSAPLVPLLDRLFPAARKHWVEPPLSEPKGAAA